MLSLDLSNIDDESLVIRFQDKSDLSIIGELYNRYSGLVFGVCLKYLKNTEDAQDMMQEVFGKLIDELKKHEVKNFRSWIYVMAKNHCLMKLRKRSLTISSYSEINPDIVESDIIWHPYINDESNSENQLKKCIEELKEQQKEIIELFYLQKLSYKEISEKRELEVKSIKSLLQNGRRNLKICIENLRKE